LLSAGNEVERVEPPDAAVTVPEVELETFGWPGDVEVQQVTVALDKYAVDAGDGDFLVGVEPCVSDVALAAE
jgi:hypothetical protein